MDKETNYAQNSRMEKNRKPMLGKRGTEMKKRILNIVFALTLIIMTGCSKEPDNMALQGEASSPPITMLGSTETSSALPPSEDSSHCLWRFRNTATMKKSSILRKHWMSVMHQRLGGTITIEAAP